MNKDNTKRITISKNSQIVGANSTGKATGECCFKKKGVSISSNNSDTLDKKKDKKTEQNLKYSKSDDNTIIKNFKSKRIFNCSDKQVKNKSVANGKKTSNSKLCIQYSKCKNAEEEKLDKKCVKSNIGNESKNCQKDYKTVFNCETSENFLKDNHSLVKEDSSNNFIKSLSDDNTSTKRENKGRQNNPDIKSDSELYGDVHLKSVLKVLRSNLSPEEKLCAIKYSHDYWQKN